MYRKVVNVRVSALLVNVFINLGLNSSSKKLVIVLMMFLTKIKKA